jgi:hypothetical protein
MVPKMASLQKKFFFFEKNHGKYATVLEKVHEK